MISVNFWNCYRDEICDAGTSEGKSCKYMTKITGKKSKVELRETSTDHHDHHYSTTFKHRSCYLSNFQRSLDFPLIISETELDLSW